MSQATSYDVAARAGVRGSVVFRTPNRPERFNPRTRARIRDAVDELGGVPWAAAVGGACRGVGRLGVLAPCASRDSYRRLTGVPAERAGSGNVVGVHDHESATATLSPLLRSLPVTGGLDGLPLTGLPPDDALAGHPRRRRLPTVLIDIERPEFTSVITGADRGIAETVGLATIRQPFEESGRLGARLLDEAITEPARPVPHTGLGLELVVRDTT